jgi:hypothetical protein
MEKVRKAKLADTGAEITVTLIRENDSVLSRSSLFPNTVPFCGEVANFGVVQIDTQNRLVFDEYSFSGKDKILDIESGREVLIAGSFSATELTINAPKAALQTGAQVDTLDTKETPVFDGYLTGVRVFKGNGITLPHDGVIVF